MDSQKDNSQENGILILDGQTYEFYTESKHRAGYKDDNLFIASLIEAASGRIHTQGSVSASGSTERAQKAQTAMNASSGEIVATARSKSADYDLPQGDRTEGRVHKVSFIKGEVADGPKATFGSSENNRLTGELPIDNASEFKCKDCGQELASVDELANHRKTCVHILTKYTGQNMSLPETRRFIYCRQCGMRCIDRLEHRKHFNKYHAHHGDLHTCKYCSKKHAFTEKKLLQLHYKTEPVCPSCEKRFTKLKTLSLHMQNKKHDISKVEEASQKTVGGKVAHVPHVIEVMNKSQQPDLPEGFNFMSVRLSPLHRLSEPEHERVVHVPETSYREGYTLQADFTVHPFPEPPDYEGSSYEEEFYNY